MFTYFQNKNNYFKIVQIGGVIENDKRFRVINPNMHITLLRTKPIDDLLFFEDKRFVRNDDIVTPIIKENNYWKILHNGKEGWIKEKYLVELDTLSKEKMMYMVQRSDGIDFTILRKNPTDAKGDNFTNVRVNNNEIVFLIKVSKTGDYTLIQNKDGEEGYINNKYLTEHIDTKSKENEKDDDDANSKLTEVSKIIRDIITTNISMDFNKGYDWRERWLSGIIQWTDKDTEALLRSIMDDNAFNNNMSFQYLKEMYSGDIFKGLLDTMITLESGKPITYGNKTMGSYRLNKTTFPLMWFDDGVAKISEIITTHKL